MASMELRPIAITPRAAARQDLRARHIAQVKFVALPMPLPVEYQAVAQGTGAARAKTPWLLALLSRVIGRLVAARP
jgi:hypothetical protein